MTTKSTHTAASKFLTYIWILIATAGLVAKYDKMPKIETWVLDTALINHEGVKCNQSGLEMLWVTNHKLARKQKHHKPNILIVLRLLLLLAGDIEMNPGPTVKYPCGQCNKAVKLDSVACNTCDRWYHRKCLGMRKNIFLNLGDASWHCLNCALPNVTAFLDSTVDVHETRFDSLRDISTSESLESSVNFHPSPTKCSSPKKRTTNTTKRHHRKPVKINIINFQSINNKKADLLNLIESDKPDVIAGSETWLNSSVSSSEIFPQNYNVYRSDRTNGSHGGGALLAITNELVTERIETKKDLEAVFIKTGTQKGKPPLIIGSIYRPTNRDLDYTLSLCETIEKIQKKYKKASIWLCGDFNLPDICWHTHSIKGHQYPKELNQRFLDMMHTCGLSQMVDQPTRESNILDLFFTNRPALMLKCSVEPGLSDHHIVAAENRLVAQRRKPLPRKIFLWKRANYSKLKQEVTALENTMLEKFDRNTHINEIWNFFTKEIKSIQDRCVPSKIASVRFHQPWITTDIKRLSRSKRKAFRKAKLTNRPSDWDRYKDIKKKTRQLSKHTYHQFLNDLMTEESGEHPQIYNKRFWSYIKSRLSENIGISTLKDRFGNSVTDSKSKSSLLNDQFTSVFVQKSPHHSLEKAEYPSMERFEITTEGVKKLLSNLKTHKAPGPDGLTPQLLKSVAEEVAPILRFIYETSLDQGEIPDDWRHANVSPIFKKGDRERAENYRPVSLTSVACKIMEHILSSQINRHLEKHGILCNSQHGFRQRRSCETQLVSTITDFIGTIENKGQCDVILLDFSKAFDKVSHDLLLNKLIRYGVNTQTHKWISSFLNNRTQQVVVDGVSSERSEVSSGVPQGSVLGPLLFLLFINDLPSYTKHSSIRLFADDCVLYKQITSDDDRNKLQDDLNGLLQWEDDWKMQFHPEKCVQLSITLKKKPMETNYTMRSHQLEKVSSAKYLGITISSNLSWSPHIEDITSKAFSKLAFLQRNISHCPRKTKTLAYQSLIRPKLEYSVGIWDPHTKKDISRLEAVQRKAARFVTGDFGRDSSVTNMLDDLEWPPLQRRRKELKLTLFHKAYHKEVDIPIPLDTNARGSAHKFLIPSSRTNHHLYSFYPSTVRLWNVLPGEAVMSDTADKFKATLKCRQLE